MKSFILVIVLLLSPMALAHGSSHPTHCNYERGEWYDQKVTCTKDSRTWTYINKDWYSPEQIAKREEERKKQQEWDDKYGKPLMITLFILLPLLFIALFLGLVKELE